MPTPIPLELPDEILINMMSAFAATVKIGWNPLLHDPRLESMLWRVTAPTLCLWGAGDRVVPVAYGGKYVCLIPDAQLVVIPECGHLAPLEKPEAWLKAVTTFLG